MTKNDGYVSLDGVDDYINLGLENYDFGNEITLMAKVKINDYLPSQSAGVIVGNHDASGATLNFGNNGNINYMQLAVHINEGYINVATPYETGKWYTMVGTYDGNIAKLYINGELASQVEVEGKITISLMPFLIGANPQSDNIPIEHSNVDIKKIAIYNRALSAEEINESASNEIKVVDDTGLLRYVDFTNKTNYETNEIIPESIIESYFVWIPKYRYQLWDLGLYDSLTSIDTSKVHEIPIIFGDYNTSDNIEGECTTPMESGATGNCSVGDYMTHPAFLNIPSKGFWVGKFETGYEGATTVVESEVNERDANKIIVKPNVYSWRGIQTANAFYTSYDYKRNLDSHLMKNTEWGAVAYLQHSKYGSQTSVRFNNNSDYITGYQANNEPTCGLTDTVENCNFYCADNSCNISYPNSILASTTNNISGIFDMSGGAWEHTMGFILDENGQPMSGRNSLYNSGFNGAFGCPTCDNDTSGIIELTNGYNFPDSKYFEKYQYSATGGQFQKRILGDATGEMGPFLDITNTQDRRVPGSWYNDHSSFATATLPTFFYGNSWAQGHYTGMFAFGSNDGRNARYISFRLVLTPT